MLGDVRYSGSDTQVFLYNSAGVGYWLDCSIVTTSVIVAVLRCIDSLIAKKPKPKKFKSKNNYNAFVGEKLKELAISNPKMSKRERMCVATLAWKHEKPKQTLVKAQHNITLS